MLLNAKMTPEAATDASLAFESSDDAVGHCRRNRHSDGGL